MNQIKASVQSPVRKRRSLGGSQTGSPHTPSNDDKENDGPDVGGVTPMKRVPILANFEEWMKMATDNKINATNSWSFALIDYFHDMSLLREGDSVNFQKASCTLDGCVKIYTSRVDNVATETGKLLSGLADGASRKRQADADDGDGEENGDGEEGEDGERKKAKRKAQRSEATLATSFAQLQLKKMELEFSVDPLFKKASADFDEGGAKGLLLNHLTIDAEGRIVFDSSDDAQEDQPAEAEEADSQSREPIEEERPSSSASDQDVEVDVDALGMRFFPDLAKLDEQDICPSMKTFELEGAQDSLDIPFLKAPEDWKKAETPDTQANDQLPPFDDGDDGGADLGGFDMADGVGFGEGGEAWARETAVAAQPQQGDFGFDDMADGEGSADGQVGKYDPDSAHYGVTLQHSSTLDQDNILAYFDQALSKNWAGPEHWRIRKIKDASKPATIPRQRKEKEPFEIDFSAPLTIALADALYTPATSNSAITLPKAQWKSKTRNLLPDDKHFSSKSLLSLFLKPKARIGARRGHSMPAREPNNGEMDGAFWAQRNQEAADALAVEDSVKGDYDANFFQDDGLGLPPLPDDDDDEFADAQEHLPPAADDADAMGAPGSQEVEGGYGTNLVTQSRRLRPEYVQYARVAKKVDVRRLKEEMWRGIGAGEDKLDQSAALVPRGEDGTLKFTDVMNSLQSVYPKQAMADISTSYCFICLLHLANEKGLELAHSERFEEISIRRDETAVIGEGDF